MVVCDEEAQDGQENEAWDPKNQTSSQQHHCVILCKAATLYCKKSEKRHKSDKK